MLNFSMSLGTSILASNLPCPQEPYREIVEFSKTRRRLRLIINKVAVSFVLDDRRMMEMRWREHSAETARLPASPTSHLAALRRRCAHGFDQYS
jgi:hypothetical protein